MCLAQSRDFEIAGASGMLIVADENMPLVDALFSPLGEVVRKPGRQLGAADVRHADVLLVRSVTRVTREMLAGSRVRFVGTATIGTDHIDLTALQELGITLASAPGCNARAVAEYVLTCLYLLADEQGWAPHSRTVGVVGMGNVGRQVAGLLLVAGFQVIGCDPLLAQSPVSGVELRPLDELIRDCDVLALHTPLTRTGPHSTFHLLNEERLQRLRPDQVLLNAGRGEVINNSALLSRLVAGNAPTVILDVWEGEPRLMPALLEKVRLGSPHVAGYSQEGKWRGTSMVHEAYCRFAGITPAITLSSLDLPKGPVLECPQAKTLGSLLVHLTGQLCDVTRDDAALRASMAEADPVLAFDRLRRDYPPRFEFSSCTIKGLLRPEWRGALLALGFQLV